MAGIESGAHIPPISELRISREQGPFPADTSWLANDYILIDGKPWRVETFTEWSFSSPSRSFSCQAYLIGKSLVLIVCKGILHSEDTYRPLEILDKVIEHAQREKFQLILDASQLEWISRTSRDILLKMVPPLKDYWIHAHIIPSDRTQVLYHLFQSLHPNLTEYSTMAEAAQQTLLEVIRNTGPKRIPSPDNRTQSPMLKDISAYSKEELYDMVKDLSADMSSIQRGHGNQLDALSQLISNISWDAGVSFQPVHTEDVSDDFQNLIQATSILQQDVYEIVNKFKTLNNTLEKQVADRTRELAFKQANLAALIENTSDMIISVDNNFRVLVVNSALNDVCMKINKFRLKPGMDLMEVLPKGITSYMRPYFDQALAGETVKTIDFLDLRSGPKYYEYSLNPICNTAGEITGISFFCKDLTEKQIAHEEVKRNQQLLASINYSIKEAIFRSSPKEGIIYVNKAFIEMFGYDSFEDLQQIDIYDLYVDNSRRDDFVRMIQEQDYFTNEEVLYKRKDGSTFWGMVSSIKTVDDNGNVYHDGAIRDVTKTKEAERLLKEQYMELKKVNRELDQFVYSTSHDLRAPLVSVAGLIHIARIEQREDVRTKYFDLMEKSINKLDNFIRDIIGYSRNARAEMKREEINLPKIIREAFNSLSFAEDGPPVEKRINIQGEGPLMSDPTRLEIIFNNLISNALRYRDPEKPICFIEINIQLDPKVTQIEIRDNGIGIEACYMDRIFEMFFRATKKSKGSGIGLYIVKEAINKLEGSISAESEFGKETTFRLEIPSLAGEGY